MNQTKNKVLKGQNLITYIGVFGILSAVAIFSVGSVFAHSHSGNPTESYSDENLDEVRLVDFGDGQPRWMTRRELYERSEFVHSEGRCGGFMDITGQPTVDSSQLMPVSQFLVDLPNRVLSENVRVNQAMGHLTSDRLQSWVSQLSNFRNRYYQSPTGVEAANWIKTQFENMSVGRNDVTVELVTHRFAQPSVIATIKGHSADPAKAAEIIVLGGHLDSINQSAFGSANMLAPGADDNASGIATLLEVFHALMQSNYMPERTIQIMGYAGEERGLLGSQDIANSYRGSNKPVVAVMQFDMTSFPGSGNQMTFITDHVNPDLTAFSKRLTQTYVQVPFSDDRCGYACSDHASWTRASYASVMPTESRFREMNGAIHSTRDTLALLNFAQGLHFAKLGVSFAIELSAK